VKLLAAGDIHLGRALSGVSADQTSRLSPAVAWNRLVDTALALGVDGLLLTGDVVDRDRVFFEAYGLLAEGVGRLASASIPVIAIAGNHDVAALPQLSDALGNAEHFRLLGRDGCWESCELRDKEGHTTTIVGWSFPAPHHSASPLAESPALPSGSDVIGLLHTDLDVAGSPYAPVRRTELQATGIPIWLLGHMHIPTPLDGSNIYYTGSLQGLDRSENGAHGAILLERSNGSWHLSRIPIAPLRYETLGPFLPEAFADQATAARTLATALQVLRDEDDAVTTVVATLLIEGRSTESAATFRQRLGELVGREQALSSITLLLHRITCRLSPVADLGQLSQGRDLCARLAQLILLLQEGSTSIPQDMHDLAEAVMKTLNSEPLLRDSIDPLPLEDASSHLLQAAQDLLHALLDQRDVAHE
jgi:hypothetical protein